MRYLLAHRVFSGVSRVMLLAGTSLVAAPEYYKLPNIRLIGHDLYRSAEVVIETRACHHLAVGEEALLVYEGPGEYAIVWQDRSTCDVQRVAVLD